MYVCISNISGQQTELDIKEWNFHVRFKKQFLTLYSM